MPNSVSGRTAHKNRKVRVSVPNSHSGTCGAQFKLRESPIAVLACIAIFSSSQSMAAEVPDDQSGVVSLDKVVVTSRNREEIAQDVPIPETVISSKTLDKIGTYTVQDLTKLAPGLEATTPNARRTGISLRGIGKSTGNEALEASMGVIVDDIFLTNPGMTYQDFTDLDRVEVLRGPQGTLLGKNTTVGAIHYVSKTPSFTPQTTFNVTLGSFASRTVNASISNAIVDNLLAYRASFFVDKANGFINNVNPIGGTTNEKNRSGGRLQFLATPSENFAAKVNLDFSQTNEDSNTKPPITTYAQFCNPNKPSLTTIFSGCSTNPGGVATTPTPARSYFGGYQPIVGSWTAEDLNWNVPLQTYNTGASVILNWNLPHDINLTSITGGRHYGFDAKNDNDGTRFDVGYGGTYVQTSQLSQEFRLAQKLNEKIDYQAGAFYERYLSTTISRNTYGVDAGAWYSKAADYATLYGIGANAGKSPAGTALLQASLNGATTNGTETPDTKSSALFGQLNWHFTEKVTLTAGLRETYEIKTSTSTKTATDIYGNQLADLNALGATLGATPRQITSATNIRSQTLGTATAGTLYATKQGTAIKDIAPSFLISPSYKLNEQTLLYASVATSQKSGAVQFTTSGTPANVDPEKAFDIEAGFKTVLNNNLLLNLNIYRTLIKGYQQTTSTFDPVTTAQKSDGSNYYTSGLGNIPGIITQGIEIDGSYSPNRQLSLTFGTALNDAYYSNWYTATCPSEITFSNTSPTLVCNNTGKQVAAAPKAIVDLGADYHRPLAPNFTGHVWWNGLYRSRQNFDGNLSLYGWQEAYSVHDIGLGVAVPHDKFEIGVVVKNVANTKYTTSINGAGGPTVSYDGMGDPRTLALTIHAKL